MQIVTGCTILRDAKGNPGEMILHKREATEAEADAYCRRFYDLACAVDCMVRQREAEKERAK